MTFEELAAKLPIGGRGARVTWAFQYYVQHDPDGVIRLKSSLEPDVLGADWSKRSGYDRNADDFVVLTGQLYCPMLESIVGYHDYDGELLRVMLNEKLQYVLAVSVESPTTLTWDIVPNRKHELEIHRHPYYPGKTPVSAIDISRIRANQIGH